MAYSYTSALENYYRDLAARPIKDLKSIRSRLWTLKGFFGQCNGDPLTVADFEAYVDERTEEGKSRTTILKELSLFCSACTHGGISLPPFDVHYVKGAVKNLYTLEDVQRVIDCLPGYLQVFAKVALLTGWSRKEIADLRWAEVHEFDSGATVSIVSRKVVQMWQVSMSVIRLFQLGLGLPLETERVFVTPRGKPIKDFTKVWNQAAAHAGVSGLKFCDLRHYTGLHDYSHAVFVKRLAA